MRRFGIITHFDVHNHGALLQLTALIRVLAAKGIVAKALRYEKNYDFLGHKLKAKYDISIKSIGLYLKYLRDKGVGCTIYNYRKHRTLTAYKSSHEIIGDYYSEASELDGVIIGSDEVFALHTGPTPVLFGHCSPSDKVIAYAASFGPTTIEDIYDLHCISLVKSGLESMSGITVRDLNSANIVKQLIGFQPPVVVDPVILYGFQSEISSLSRPYHKEYLLIYAYDNRMNSKEEVEAIKEYAKLRGLKTLSAGFYHKWCDINMDVDPINLLAYFKYATEVITDTFHGCVMSLITNAKFAVKYRLSNYFKLYNLLNEYGVEDRLFDQYDCLEQTINRMINYKEINEEISSRRNFSMQMLDRLLDGKK